MSYASHYNHSYLFLAVEETAVNTEAASRLAPV